MSRGKGKAGRRLTAEVPVPVSQRVGQPGYDEPADRPGVVHGHPQVDLPLPAAHLHRPDEGGGVAGDGHGARDPPGEDKHRVPSQYTVQWWRGWVTL